MTRSNNYKPFMAYFEPKEYLRLKKFSKDTKTPMAQILREAAAQRMNSNNPYTSGFNDGIETSIITINNLQAAQMRFPSGKTFAELFEEALVEKRIMEVPNEAGIVT